jgi:cytochrome c biogenesis protein CcdA/thiol-disulfide isomerase/thioredoxin
MTLILLAFLGGALTILSPCILPVLPFVFARAEQPFLKSGLPLLAGMAVTFTGIATLAAVGGAWAVRINQYGRVFALDPAGCVCGDPAVAAPVRLAGPSFRQTRQSTVAGACGTGPELVNSLVLGVATGLLWAPCAGPILGLVLTGAALSGPNARTTLLLVAYAAGAAASLALATLAGGRIFKTLKKSLGAGEWIRRGLGVAVLGAVIAIALGWDRGLLTQLSYASTNRVEQSLINAINPHPPSVSGTHSEGELPSLSGASSWLNSAPLTPEALRGSVVVVDFWTYSCINCLRSLPFVEAWYKKYKITAWWSLACIRRNLHLRGMKTTSAVQCQRSWDHLPGCPGQRLRHLAGVQQPVLARALLYRSTGQIRGHHFGEGDYDQSEQIIRQLLTEAGYTKLGLPGTGTAEANGVQAAADVTHVQSPETYLGYRRAQSFASPGAWCTTVLTPMKSGVAGPEPMGIGRVVGGRSRESGAAGGTRKD